MAKLALLSPTDVFFCLKSFHICFHGTTTTVDSHEQIASTYFVFSELVSGVHGLEQVKHDPCLSCSNPFFLPFSASEPP